MAESSLTFEYRSITLFINFCGDLTYKYRIPKAKKFPNPKLHQIQRFWKLQL
ncbi:hypothetical protein LguiB_018054 [Lonicera macranthoides]